MPIETTMFRYRTRAQKTGQCRLDMMAACQAGRMSARKMTFRPSPWRGWQGLEARGFRCIEAMEPFALVIAGLEGHDANCLFGEYKYSPSIPALTDAELPRGRPEVTSSWFRWAFTTRFGHVDGSTRGGGDHSFFSRMALVQCT